jgi:carbamoyl-phosphate synthase large subunit
VQSKRNILVTGVGGGVGQGIYFALNKEKHNIFVSDSHKYAAGLYLTKNHFITGNLEESDNFEKFIKLIRSNKIDVILPGNEYDVLTLSKNKSLLESATKAIVIVSPKETIELTNDKWRTYEYLKSKKIAIPKTYLWSDNSIMDDIVKDIAFPWIIKPRFGTASRGVVRVTSLAQAQELVTTTSNPLIQEQLVNLEQNELGSEYTCSVFRDMKGNFFGPFVARRSLRNGTSWIVEVISKPDFDEYLLSIAQSLDYSGPLNIQLIETKSGPKLLEINCRFSGTTGIRSYFGFNEPEMSITSFYDKKSIKSIELKEGTVLRYIKDIIVEHL